MVYSALRAVYAAVLIYCTLPYAGHAEREDSSCGSHATDIPIRSVVASANVLSNWWGSPGSISFESNEIFQSVKDRGVHIEPSVELCPRGCAVNHQPVMFFRSVPKRVLTDYEDSKKCAELLSSTSERPLHYVATGLQTMDEITDWISDLSRGRGTDGENLYKKCDGSCSPQYEYAIRKTGTAYTIDAFVICGAARDKSDNNYNLEAFFRWTCVQTGGGHL